MKQIYLDNAATTQMRPEALEAMMPHLTVAYGNASSIYPLGEEAAEALAEARHTVASAINADDREVYFTSGGSESDNWALIATAEAYEAKGKHIIASAIEHHAILHTAEYLEKRGFEVTRLPVDETGRVSPAVLEAAMRPDTILVSIMFANNEIGTVEPIAELAKIAHDHGALFHTDAVQAFGHLPIDVKELGVDLLSASAHKIYGPKGTGLLYLKRGVKTKAFIHGGQQERGLRAGTENVAGIVGFAKATELALTEQDEETARLTELRDHAIERIEREIPHSRLNGHRSERLPNNVNFSFEFIEGEGMLLQLAFKGISASSGSACTSGSLDPSHVLLAIGLPHEIAHGSLRLTLGRETTREDIDYTIDTLKATIENLRAMSPLYEDFVKSHKKAS
ncbi:cysteine desulfurase NifS [Raoultibacter phocaeensis]|uniref:cysteine desulfurase NifS n=1 Tax=Raoultibacter phocaeensis TaxID=2479841 RepID=UPI0011183DF5|nr:cysteine desulfurase NifS [Raoultibacter phocaeensis]